MIQTAEVYRPLYENRDKFVVLVTGGRGCEHPDTPVMMADLSVKAIKDIRVGDRVMGDDGTPRTVLRLFSGRSPMYRVRQSSAEDYIVNDSHILTLKRSESAKRDCGGLTKKGTLRRPNGRYPGYGDGSTADISVLEYAGKSKRFRENFRGFKSESIPYPESHVSIPPYLLGVWLGDGTSIYPAITNPDSEIEEYVARYCSENGLILSKQQDSPSDCPYLRIKGDGKRGNNSFLNNLKAYGLIGNKHIPQCYISNSESARLELLAGLLDTDGSIGQKGVYEITQKSESMARQIKFVADTLGFRTSITPKNGSINGESKGTYYRVIIGGDLWRIPCRVARKKVAEGDMRKNKDWHLSMLKIEPLGEGEWRGICLDGNQRYLHADGTVTHNSGKSFALGTFIERLTFETGVDEQGNTKPHVVLYTRYSLPSAKMSVIPEVKEKIDLDGTAQYFHTTQTDIVNELTGGRIMFRGIMVSTKNQTAKLKSIQGITTFVCDEAEEFVDEDSFDKLALSIRQKGIQNRVVIIMNPADSSHFIYRKYIKDTHRIEYFDGVPVQISTHPDVLHIHTTYFDNLEHLSDQFIRDMERMKAEEPEKYAHVAMGRWVDQAEGAVFKDWEECDEFPAHAKRVAAGVDFGYTNDPSACVRCGVVGDDLYLDEVFYRRGMLISDLARELVALGLPVYPDSADPRLLQELANKGVIIFPVSKGAGSIMAGIERMKEFRHIYVTARSANLMNELRNYVWAKDRYGNPVNYPEDHDNHACFTAGTMVQTESGPKPISSLRVGEGILTTQGVKPLDAVYDNGEREIWKAGLDFGSFSAVLEATADHRLKTQQGWKRISDIKPADKLCVCGKAEMAELKGIEILEKRTERVYDLNVRDAHEYFAQGILAHNCDAARYWCLGNLLGQIIQPKKYNPETLGIF